MSVPFIAQSFEEADADLKWADQPLPKLPTNICLIGNGVNDGDVEFSDREAGRGGPFRRREA
jgi:hypothetical protein